MELPPEYKEDAAYIKSYYERLAEVVSTQDEAKIRAWYQEEFGFAMPADPERFWVAIHKVTTALKDVPKEIRRKSKEWLEKRGYRSYDDGDLYD